MSETQKNMKMVTTWGCKRNQKYLLQKLQIFSDKKIMKEKYKRELFGIEIFLQFHQYKA